MSRVPTRERDAKSMAAWRRAIELSLGEADTGRSSEIDGAWRERLSRADRAPATRCCWPIEKPFSFFADQPGARGSVIETVQRCVGAPWPKAAGSRWMIALAPVELRRSLPRPGRRWCRSSACRKAKELRYPHELWTTRLLARHARQATSTPRRDVRASPTSAPAPGLRDPGPGGRETAQSAMLPGTARSSSLSEKIWPKLLSFYWPSESLEAGRSRLAKKPSDAMAIISSTRSPAYRPSQRTAPTCRPSPACMRPSHVSINATSRHDHFAGRHRPRHRQGPCAGQGSPTAAREFIEFLKLSTPPIRPTQRSS